MKKLLFTGLLGLGLLLPASFSATTGTISSAKEFSTKKPKKGKTKSSRKSKSTGSRYTRSYSQSRGCTYNGNQLYVGSRGGCYYYSGSSKQYVDRSYCSGCN
ncbi:MULTISPECIES: hypothetical protein [unclassified Chryseobacterium]|uniref:hypothetical protein n=1 Tax=unclassified Chryseobacterium TaxID=2593645 RepID=UPI0009D8951E|nr:MULTISPECIES: hypothetical protein [unclassified Chryseobacterium]SMC91551.1 hypothetical protein SAMN02787074_3737 [Chryseobacterium sp. YR221]